MSLLFDPSNYQQPGVFCGSDESLEDLDPISLCAWIRPTGWGESNYGRIYVKGTSPSVVFYLSNGGGGFGISTIVYYRGRSSVPTTFRGADNAISLDVWQHVVVTSSGTGTKLYVNGVEIGYIEETVGSGTLLTDVDDDAIIGNTIASNRGFDGESEDVRVYNRVLSDKEIQGIYTGRGHDGIVYGLAARWPLCEQKPDHPAIDSPYFKGADRVEQSYAASISLTPQNAADGDLLFAVIASSGDFSGTPPNITTPSGWTLLSSVDCPAYMSTPNLSVYRRTASSESGSYAFNCNQTCTLLGYMATFDGDEIGDVQDVLATATGTSTTGIAPTVTTTENCLIFRCVVLDAQNIAVPSYSGFPTDCNNDYVERLSGGGLDGVSIYLATQWLPTGATGTASFSSYGYTDWAACTIAFPGGNGVGDYRRLRDLSNNKNNGKASNGWMVHAESQLALGRRS